MKNLIVCLLLIAMAVGCKPTNEVSAVDEQAVIQVLKNQELAWNNGDINGFMRGYWNSPKLSFTSNNTVTTGWNQTWENFQKAYPTQEKMGELNFEIEQLNQIYNDAYHIIGKFTLTRKDDSPTGFFTLIVKKIDGKWKITSDHTCG